jgi:hypothetical protein
MEAMGHPQCSASGAIVGGLGPCARMMVTRMMPETLWLASLTTRLPVAGYSVHLTTAYSDDASTRNVCKVLNDIKLNCLYFPVMKTWMSHGMAGIAKWVNFEHL